MENGLAIIHANHLEDLTAVTVDWLRQNPLAPLEQDIFLVESNGIAQWLKLALADDGACGISAAQQFQMPQRFLWQAYRTVLGDDRVPRTSPFDKARLHWRLMRLLPQLMDDDAFLPLRQFLADDTDQRKRYQLTERLADLFDQYQVYRADWLQAWEEGRDEIATNRGIPEPLAEQRWQAILWRALVADMPAPARHTSRSAIHQRFLDTLSAGSAPPGLDRRIIVFGISSLPQQVLEALHALSPYCQILMLVQNPCQHYWADIIEDRELLRRQQTRHRAKPALAALAADDIHRHANPLLATWGKQGRDYIGLLYDYDVPEQSQQWFQSIDLFRSPLEGRPASLLGQIQHAIFDLEPLPDAAAQRRSITPDASLGFQVAHSRQREVEILHDQLLARFEGDAALIPRDIIVMVPDIQSYAPHIDAVFGNMDRDDPRHIPFTISDRSQRHTRPLAKALEKLLDAPQLRFTVSDVLDLLDVPALRNRFDIHESDLPLLHQWIHGSGIRWGLHAGQRASLALPENLQQNSWWFGLKRMLLGYAVGDGDCWQDIEPYDEVGGLGATLAGQLATLLQALEQQWDVLRGNATPQAWVQRLLTLMDALFLVEEEEDLQLQASLISSLQDWQAQCIDAGYEEPLPLSVARTAWLSALDQGSLSQRFLAGRVNFCTLMPMRSIPFKMVCLLGMNDGDYPRSQTPLDFDLMSRRGHYRPGDRSRREDDRYLFLEALLSARQELYISWVGRNARDNSVQPPSVLVAQLRDYIDSGWCHGPSPLSSQLTTEHPLQPFSTRYFSADNDLFTFAHEWRHAHNSVAAPDNTALTLPTQDATWHVSTAELARFLKQPPQLFYNERLKVRMDEQDSAAEDNEPFGLGGLDRFRVAETLLDAARQCPDSPREAFDQAQQRLRRAGQIPAGEPGAQQLAGIAELAWQAVVHWHTAQQAWPHAEPARELALTLSVAGQQVSVEDWLTDLVHDDAGNLARLLLMANEMERKPWRTLNAWTTHLCACAAGTPLTTWLLAGDICQRLEPLEPTQAHLHLEQLLQGWLAAHQAPLPTTAKTGLAFLGAYRGDPLERAAAAYDTQHRDFPGEVDQAGSALLKRSFASFDAMTRARVADVTAFEHWTRALYAPLHNALRKLKLEAQA